MDKPLQTGLPIAGYRPQSEDRIALVNEAKQLEERVLRFLDRVATQFACVAPGDLDGRWFATGRTDIEKGFMSVNRSIFKPDRIALPEDEGTAS
jgi:hypothetical protein